MLMCKSKILHLAEEKTFVSDGIRASVMLQFENSIFLYTIKKVGKIDILSIDSLFHIRLMHFFKISIIKNREI